MKTMVLERIGMIGFIIIVMRLVKVVLINWYR